MRILAVDPGKFHHSYSVWENGNIIDYGKHITDDIQFWDKLVSSVDRVYIEDQYLGEKAGQRGVSVRAMFSLVRAAHEIATLAKLRGKPFEYVNPKRWESKVLHASGRMKREEIKHVSKVIASEVVNDKIVDHDVADAINIGLAVITKAIKSDEEVYGEDKD